MNCFLKGKFSLADNATSTNDYSPILSRGYLNDVVKTKAAFIEAPEWARTADGTTNDRKFYCTGDLVYYTSEGEMMYLGRKDSQVKVCLHFSLAAFCLV